MNHRLASATLALAILTAAAQAELWNTGTGNWSLNTNWTPNTVPDGIGALADLSGPISNTSVITIDATSRTVGTLYFGSSTASAAITLAASGGASLIFNNGLSDAVLTMPNPARGINITAPITLNTTLRLNNNSTFSGGSLSFGGGFSGNGTIINQGSGNHTISFQGTLNGVTLRQNSSTSTSYLGVSGQPSMGGLVVESGILAARNNFTATNGLTLAGGTLILGRDTSLTFTSSPTTVTASSTMQSARHSSTGTGAIHNLGALSIGNQTLTVEPRSSGGPGVTAVTSGTAGFRFGATTLTGINSTFNIVNSAAASASLQLQGVGQTGTSSLTKTGSGTLVLTGASTYTGTTTVTEGTIRLTGTMASSSLAVQGGTFDASTAPSLPSFTNLSGSGSVAPGAKTVVISAGGQLAPGNSPGTLEIQGNLDLSAIADTGGLVFELGNPDSDLVLVTNGGVLNVGTLNFADFTFSPIAGFGLGTYTLFDTGTTILGSIGVDQGTVGGIKAFLSFANGGQDVILTVIPEPASALLMALAALAIHRRRR